MPRTSPVHYIAPSAISITPNCNSSANDLAVYLARDAKIRVYSKEAGIDYVNADFQQWTIKGRNRRLADSAKPYTIYARLSKTDKTDGYLVFAPKNQSGGIWYDKYAYVIYDAPGLAIPEGAVVSSDYWYIRIGDVSLPENGQRTITYDTGILGTDQYNTEWTLNPDLLKRIILTCTIDNKDAGSTPYVYWDKSLVFTAQMMAGWTDPEVASFDHWEIERDTDDTAGDAAWQRKQSVQAFSQSGTITLAHPREGDDDFNGTVSAVFKVIAWGRAADNTLRQIAATSISIMAEVIETYTLALSTVIVSYNPQTKTYSPEGGVAVRVRAKDQRGDLIRITNEQFDLFGLELQYKRVSDQSFTDLPLDGGQPQEVAVATIPVTVFAAQEGVEIRLINTEGKELDVSSVAFVRDGEDSKVREWIFLPSSVAITFGDASSEHPLPALIDGGEVSPHGPAGGSDHNKQQDDWVPQGWSDDSVGTTEDTPYEYGSYRDYVDGEDGEDGHWGDFVTPRVWSHYGEDAVTYDIIPSVSVINADSEGGIVIPGIAVKAYRTQGIERSENILPEGDPPSSGDYYFAEYSIDGGTWARCGRLTEMEGYGVDGDIVATTEESIVFRLKHTSDTSVVLKESLPINVVRTMSEEYARERYLSKLYDDVAQGVITFVRGIKIGMQRLIGVAVSTTGEEEVDNDELIATPGYVENKYMAKYRDEYTEHSLEIGENLDVDNNLQVLGDVKIDGKETVNDIQSSEYTGDGMLDTGYKLWYQDGRAKLVIDDLVARGKFTVNELESRIWTYAGGNMIFSGAGSTIFLVEYLDGSDTPLGYTYINSPWLLAGRSLLAQQIAWSKRRRIQRSLTPDEQSRVVKFRCYEYSDDGTMQTRNWWHVNDLAYCSTLNHVKDKTTGSTPHTETYTDPVTGETVTETFYSQGTVSNNVYWRRVAAVGSKTIESLDDDRVYDYVDLWNVYDVRGQEYEDTDGRTKTITDDVRGFLNMAGSGQAPSADWPAAGDVIVQRGNPLDADRQSCVTIEVQGDVHGLKVYDTINDYTMANKQWIEIGYDQQLGRAKANIYGDFRFGHRPTENGSFISYNRSTGELVISAKITAQSTVGDQEIEEYVDDLIHDVTDGIEDQMDKKIETWYQSSDPSTTWITTALKKEHVGDLWYCTANIGTSQYKKGTTWRYNSSYQWEQQNIPQSAFDRMDGKASIFISKPDTPREDGYCYRRNDMWILEQAYTLSGVNYKAGTIVTASQDATSWNASHWSKHDMYTDDSAFNSWKSSTYASDLTGLNTGINNAQNTANGAASAASSAATTANDAKSKADALDYVKNALNSDTVVDGGLILTSLIGLRQNTGTAQSPNYVTTGGIQGYKGDGTAIAAWFGGPMIQDPNNPNKAKIVFRHNGSGYLAGGNIEWDVNGNCEFAGKVTSASGTIGGFDIGSDHLGESLTSTAAGTTYMNKNGHISLRNPSNADGGNPNGAIFCTGGVLLQGDSTRLAQLSNSNGETLIFGKPLNLNTQNNGNTYIGSSQSELISNSSKNTFAKETVFSDKVDIAGVASFGGNIVTGGTTGTFTLPGTTTNPPKLGTSFMCKGISRDLTVTAPSGFKIQASDSRNEYQSLNLGASSYIITYMGSNKWGLFNCN